MPRWFRWLQGRRWPGGPANWHQVTRGLSRDRWVLQTSLPVINRRVFYFRHCCPDDVDRRRQFGPMLTPFDFQVNLWTARSDWLLGGTQGYEYELNMISVGKRLLNCTQDYDLVFLSPCQCMLIFFFRHLLFFLCFRQMAAVVHPMFQFVRLFFLFPSRFSVFHNMNCITAMIAKFGSSFNIW